MGWAQATRPPARASSGLVVQPWQALGEPVADPAKLSKLLNRFSALYDIKNGQTAASSPVITLYQGGGLLSNTAFAAIAKGAR